MNTKKTFPPKRGRTSSSNTSKRGGSSSSNASKRGRTFSSNASKRGRSFVSGRPDKRRGSWGSSRVKRVPRGAEKVWGNDLLGAWEAFLATKQRSRMFSFHEAVLHLRLGKEEQKTLHLWVEQGVKDGVLLKGKRDDYWNIEGLAPYEGVVDKIHSRLAFVKSPHRRNDALAHNPYDAGHKDRVSFIVLGEISGHGRHAKPRSLAYITHVISKGLSHIVGGIAGRCARAALLPSQSSSAPQGVYRGR